MLTGSADGLIERFDLINKPIAVNNVLTSADLKVE